MQRQRRGWGWRRNQAGVDGSGSRGLAGELDGRWLKLNSRVGEK